QSAQPTNYKVLGSAKELTSYLSENASPKNSLAVWAELVPERDVEPGYGSPVSSIEFSTAAGQGHSAQVDEAGETFRAIAEGRADPKRPKIVHDSKIFELVTLHDVPPDKKSAPAKGKKKADASSAAAVLSASPLAGVRDATILYSYLLRPTTANHAFPEVVLRHLNQTLSGAPGERADFLFRLAPVLRAEVEKQGLLELYEKIDLPLASVLARMERHGVRVEPKALGAISKRAVSELAALEKQIFKLAGTEFKISSPQQLAEGLFDNPNLQNIPIRTALGREIRAAFAADKGNQLLSADFSQIELRLLAHFTEDP